VSRNARQVTILIVASLGGAFVSAVLTWHYGLPLIPTKPGSGDRIALTVGVATVVVSVLLAALARIPIPPLPGPQKTDRSLRDRYDMAVKQIGTRSAPFEQQAGVAAMASLATEWPTGRQDCVDRLCGYLRLPYDPAHASHSERQVRWAIIEAIRLHLDGSSEAVWRDCRFDFSGAVFDGGELDGAHFVNGSISFRGCTFTSEGLSMRHAVFDSCRVDCSQMRIQDGSSLDFDEAIFSMTTTKFSEIEISSSGLLSFRKTGWRGGMHNFDGVEVHGGRILFDDAQFVPIRPVDGTGQRAQFSFTECKLGKGELSFRAARFRYEIERSSQRGARQPPSRHESTPPWPWTLTFHKAQLSGATVDFSKAEFIDGYVDLSYVVATAGSMLFRNAVFRKGCLTFTFSKMSDIVLDFSYAYFRCKDELGIGPFGLHPWLAPIENIIYSAERDDEPVDEHQHSRKSKHSPRAQSDREMKDIYFAALNYPVPPLDFTDAQLKNVRLEFEFVNWFLEGSGIIDFKGAYLDGADLCFVRAAFPDLIIVLWNTRYLYGGAQLRLHEGAWPIILTDDYHMTHNELIIVEVDRNREGHDGNIRRVRNLKELTPHAFGISSID
jgi:uncharacterized protein YjbI with pentapeptide repeats